MRRYAPVFVLIVLSTFIGEVLLGATPVSRLGGLVVVTPLYGGGAVLIRELARRRGPGWGRIALLGAAYAIIEEGLAIQSMFNPNLFNAGLLGGTVLGVNWVWVEWTFGYHIMRNAPSPWLVGLVTFVAAAAWFALLGLPHSLRAGALALAPMLAEIAMAIAVAALIRRWSGPDRAWTDLHRLALASGALLISMLFGFFFVTASNPIDQLGQGVASIVAIGLLALFARRLQQRDQVVTQARPHVLKVP